MTARLKGYSGDPDEHQSCMALRGLDRRGCAGRRLRTRFPRSAAPQRRAGLPPATARLRATRPASRRGRRDANDPPPDDGYEPRGPRRRGAAGETPRLMARAEVHPLGDNTARGIVEFQTAAGGTGR